jgi:hypothetical protein
MILETTYTTLDGDVQMTDFLTRRNGLGPSADRQGFATMAEEIYYRIEHGATDHSRPRE